MDFASLGLAPRLLQGLSDAGLKDPSPIQAAAIPPALQGRDLMGLAETGSGKTLAFGLPLLHKLLSRGQRPAPKTVRALILAPTRELARQIHDALLPFTRLSHLPIGLVTGGVGFTPQIERLARGLAVLVATPGRLIDLMDRGSVDLSRTEALVLDEADQMLDMGFIHALRRIAPALPRDRQTLLFSATMPALMAELAGSYLRDPVRVEVNPPGKAVGRIDQKLHFTATAAKPDVLIELLSDRRGERALVFGRTKHGADRLMKRLEGAGLSAAAIHGNKSQGQRDRAVGAFKAGEIDVLVATDVAARGLDIPGVALVVNYEMPNVPETYVHRIGRTARAGAEGEAVALVAPDEMGYLKDVEKAMGSRIPVASGAPWTPVAPAPRGGARPQGRPQAQPRRHAAQPPKRGGKPAHRGQGR